MFGELFKIIDVIAVFQLLVFIIIVSRQKQLGKANKLYLLVYVVAILWCLLDRIQFAYHHELYQVRFPHFFHSGDPFKYLFLPSVYLYIKSVTNYNFKIKWIQLLHFIPFIMTLVYLIANYSILSAEEKYIALENTDIFKPIYDVKLFDLILFFQNLYFIAGFYMVWQYQKKLKKYVSSLYWYNTFPLYLILSAFLLMLAVRFYFIKTLHKNVSIDIDFTLYAIIIIVVGFKQRQLFIRPPIAFDKLKDNSELSGLRNDIDIKMKKDKPFLDPDLTLDKLAEEFEIPTRKLSNILNTEFNVNFFNFINSYRINEAKIQLTDTTLKQKTVLEILYEVGFNNKSAFNRVFKEFTGLTPSEFRKRAYQE